MTRYLDANLYRAARLAARHCPPGSSRVAAIREATAVLRRLADDPEVADPAAALEGEIRQALG